MYKLKLFQAALAAVVEETEIESEQILSNNKQEEVVDARSMLIKIMHEQGLYPIQISHLTGIGLRSINKFLLGFSIRCNSRKIMSINYENARNKLRIQ